MSAHEEKVKRVLKIIMDSSNMAILDKDRVSLIKFSRRLNRTFSLVQKDSNFA